MSEFTVRPDPIEWMDAYSRSDRVRWRDLAGPTHGSTHGHAEMSALTGQIRIRYQFDQRWACGDCRQYKEKAEGSRIARAFEDHDMWVSVVTGDRDYIREVALEAGTDYVALPLGDGNYAVLTTSPLVPESVLADDPQELIVRVVMPLRWEGSISSSRGLLPPARNFNFWERYHPDTKRRCWHLHESKEDAAACSYPNEVDGTCKGWYTRGTTEFHKIGGVKVTGGGLIGLLAECRLGFVTDPESGVEVLLDPIRWNDPRFQRFLEEAGWEPPNENFEPPTVALRVRLNPKTGRLAGGAAV